LLRDGWRKGATVGAAPLAAALAAGAAYAAEQCYVDGAFGHGRSFDVAAEWPGAAVSS
jgi:adenosylmethionine-8-amino-7-oxononanoate aminotransferase